MTMPDVPVPADYDWNDRPNTDRDGNVIMRDAADAGGVERDANGDPVRQGSLMIEKQAYEQLIAGLRIASEAWMHLAKWEETPEGVANRRALARQMDLFRRACMQKAGIEDLVKASPTREVRGRPLQWRTARDRLLKGIRRAKGACEQLATCFRMDLFWASCARELERMERNILHPRPRNRSLVLPPGYRLHTRDAVLPPGYRLH